MGEIKTIWQGDSVPKIEQPKPKRPKPKQPAKRKHTDVDLSTLSISDDPYTGRRYKENKYEHLFNKLKHGQSIKCRSEDTDKIGQALRKWAQNNNKKGQVKGVKYYTKTTGRVFWMPVSEK
jgi:hypothetical protein